MAQGDLLIARTTAVIRIEEKGMRPRTVRIRRGVTVVRADDPALKGREKLFRPLEVSRLGGPARPARRRTERACAEPGQRRPGVDTTLTADTEQADDVEVVDDQDDDPPTESPAAESEPDAAPAEPTAREVRAWAREQVPPIEVPSRGKIPEDVVAAYKREHGGAW